MTKEVANRIKKSLEEARDIAMGLPVNHTLHTGGLSMKCSVPMLPKYVVIRYLGEGRFDLTSPHQFFASHQDAQEHVEEISKVFPKGTTFSICETITNYEVTRNTNPTITEEE